MQNIIEELRGDALQRVVHGTEVEHERTADPVALNHDPRRGNTRKHKVGATTGAKAVWACQQHGRGGATP